jgi:putative transposase
MSVQRKRSSTEVKTRVAREALKGQKTANEIAAEYEVHPTQMAQGKKQALDGFPEVFSPRTGTREKSEEALIASLSQHRGQLKVQGDWREKKSRAAR